MAVRNVYTNVLSRTNKQLCVWNGKNMEAFSGAKEFGNLYVKLPDADVYVHSNEIFRSANREWVAEMLMALRLDYVDQETHDEMRAMVKEAMAKREAYAGVISEWLVKECSTWTKSAAKERENLPGIAKRELEADSTNDVIRWIGEFLDNVVHNNDPQLPEFHLAIPEQIAAIVRIRDLDLY